MRWCAGDDRLIMRGVGAWGPDKVGALLGVPADAVAQRYRELAGVDRPWSAAERETLSRHWIGKSAVQLAAMLDRTPEEVIAEAEALGLTTDDVGLRHLTRWSQEHHDILVRHYPTLGPTGVAEMVGRPPRAVASYAKKFGIRSRQPNIDWTPEQDAELLRLRFQEGLTYQACGKRMGRTTLSIKARLVILKKMGRSL